MPREREAPVREGGFKQAEKFYIISFEGYRSEPKYFEALRHSEYFNDSGLIETISIKRKKKSASDPLSVKKLLKKAKSEYNFKKTDEFWLVIDRDDWGNVHNINFDVLLADCKQEGNFFLAMSNPCFELWLLLHLKELEEFSETEQTAILKNEKISKKKSYIDAVLGKVQAAIGYSRGYNKRPNPNIYLPKIYIAIQRAKDLDVLQEDYPKNLGSHVYKLVEKLVKK